MHQGQRQVQLLARAARELLDPVAAVALEAELGEECGDGALARLIVEAVGAGEQHEVLVDGQLVPEHRRLRAVAEPAEALDPAPVAAKQAHDDLHQRALARAVLADQADQLARANHQARAAKDVEAPAPRGQAATEALLESFDPQYTVA